MGERMEGEHGCAVAKLQVSEVSSGQQGPEVMFEFMPLPVPPVGFEPTLTAPEAVAMYAPDQRKRVPAHHDRGRIGGSALDLGWPGTLSAGEQGRNGLSAWPTVVVGQPGMQIQVHDRAVDRRRKIDDLADADGVSSPATPSVPGVIWPVANSTTNSIGSRP